MDADEAEQLMGKEREVILVRPATNPEDIHGMHTAAGILTARGGMTSHADVVAEGIGLCRTEHIFFEPKPHSPGHARDDLRRL